MYLETVKELLAAFDASGVTRMRLACDGLEVELEKGQCVAPASAPLAPSVLSQPAAVMAPAANVGASVKAESTKTQVTSPIVGIFYPSSSPEAAPYVQVGQTVKKGDTLCIIEAMKVMNEVPSPCDGVIAAILAEREQLMEYGQVMMLIDER